MEDKKPTTTEDRRHEVRPEHMILRDAMVAWTEEAAESEKRSCIVIRVIAKDGELNASSHISGDAEHLVIAAQACMSSLAKDNPVGSVLRVAAVRALTEIGIIAPQEPNANGVPGEQQPESPEAETHNNNEHE